MKTYSGISSEKTTIGFAMCGSFCTLSRALDQMQILKKSGYDILPIMSFNVFNLDTKFGKANDFIERAEQISGKSVIHNITGAEPIGPKNMADILVAAPCTGNTLAKFCNGITDTPVTMAIKSQLRIRKPVVIALASNDALGNSAQNLGKAINIKNVFFTPMSQDDPESKPNSLVAHFEKLPETIDYALKNKQIEPIFT